MWVSECVPPTIVVLHHTPSHRVTSPSTGWRVRKMWHYIFGISMWLRLKLIRTNTMPIREKSFLVYFCIHSMHVLCMNNGRYVHWGKWFFFGRDKIRMFKGDVLMWPITNTHWERHKGALNRRILLLLFKSNETLFCFIFVMLDTRPGLYSHLREQKTHTRPGKYGGCRFDESKNRYNLLNKLD